MSSTIDLSDLAGLSGNNEGKGGAIPSDFDAENAPNAAEIEQQFAVVCVEHAETYWKLLEGIKASTLPRLTKHDEEIMQRFKELFPELQSDSALRLIKEEEMKSVEGKKKWREFLMPFEKTVQDYNFGTLIRSNCEEDYSESNAFFCVRLQFYAIEIARNRRGLNDQIYERAQAEKSKS